MTKTYRIKEYDYGHCKQYEIQRKTIFGFWYNPDNIDAYTTGWFDTLEEAKECIKRKQTKTIIKIIEPQFLFWLYIVS